MLPVMVSVAAAIMVAQAAPQPGDSYEIRTDRESTTHNSDGGNGSASDRDVLIERVIAVRDDGLELEYDLPKGATADDRAINWQFPARVFQPTHGALQLLNGAVLEGRVTAWLTEAKLPRSACGHWYFTWNAFQVECDPLSVLRTIAALDLCPDLREGALYRDPRARAAVPLVRKAAGSDDATLVAEMALDPDAVRRDSAAADVVIGEVTRKPVTLESALRAHAAEVVSGTITVSFVTDDAGAMRRRTIVTRRETRKPGGRVESETVTETLERQLIPPGR